MKTEYANCDLCGSTEYAVLWDKTEREKAGVLRSKVIRDGDTIIHGRNVMCMRCGLVYVNPRMPRGALDKFYAEDYRKVYNSPHSEVQEQRHGWRAFDILNREICAEREKIRVKILDVGCSTGQFLAMAGTYWKLLNSDLCGIEPNEEYCKKATDAGLNATNCTIENYNPGIQFDIITMLNALEHVISPTVVLQKVHSLLTDSGHFLCCVPNLLSTHITRPVDAFMSNAHLYNFTPATLHMMMAKVGLHIVKAWPIPEEMGEKIYVLAQKGEPTEIVFDDNIGKRYKWTKRFLEEVNEVFVIKHYLSGGIE